MYDSIRSPEIDLMDTVAHIQLEVEALTFVQSGPSPLDIKTLPVQSKPVAFTSTKVTKFSGVTNWDQYRQVFDAIVRSNGWDDAMTALQLLSHLEGDALNVGAGGKTGHAGTSLGTNQTLRITGPVNGLSTPVREDDSAGRGGPVDIRNCSGNTCG